MKRKRFWLLMVVFFVPFTIIFTQCLHNDYKTDARGEQYAGDARCVKCHQKIFTTYIHSAHYGATRPASARAINGSFSKLDNLVTFGDQSQIAMVQKGNNFYQILYKSGKKIRAERFDIVFGGKKAETFAYWIGNHPFQLPVSYFKTLHGWTNSPGYNNDSPYFDRLIEQRCFECHTSFIKKLPEENAGIRQNETEFDKKSIVYGIDCERCHGPAARHVDFQTSNPTVKTPKFIVSYQSLTRSQKLDFCAVCHDGNKNAFLVSAFKFIPGDALADFKEPAFRHVTNPTDIDVHGNQTGLLSASKCFLMSNLDCTTCHDEHNTEGLSTMVISQRCIKCHNTANHNFCKISNIATTLNNNCVDCHMPLRASNVISVSSKGEKKATPYLVHTHYIAIYPDQTQKVLATINKLGHAFQTNSH